MLKRRGLAHLGAALGLMGVLAGCGPASAVLPQVKAHPTLVAVDQHPVKVLSDHPTLVTKSFVLSVTPAALTRGDLEIWIKPTGKARRRLLTIGGADYKWLKRWQLSGSLLLLEIGTPPSAKPKSNEYEHVLLAVNLKNGKVLYQGAVALTTIAYLDPPWLVKAGPASLLGHRQAVWLINLAAGVQKRVLFPPNTVGVGEVSGGRVYFVESLNGVRRRRSLKIPSSGWKRLKNVTILKVTETKKGGHAAAGGVPTQS